jgi:TRAP-type C4-dicarboxylate transport system permease small subunit
MNSVKEGVIERLSRYLSWAGGAIILASAVLVTLDVLGRNIFNATLFESLELSVYGYAIAVAFAFSFALTAKTHIRIDVVLVRLPVKLRAVLDVFAMLALFCLAVVFAYYGWEMFRTAMRMNARSASDLQVLLAIPQGIWALGLTWFAFVAGVYLLRGLVMLVRGKIHDVQALMGIEDGIKEALEESREGLAASAILEGDRK